MGYWLLSFVTIYSHLLHSLRFFPEKRRKSGRNRTNFTKTPIFEATNNPELHNSWPIHVFKFLSLENDSSKSIPNKIWMTTLYKDDLWCSAISRSLKFIMNIYRKKATKVYKLNFSLL